MNDPIFPILSVIPSVKNAGHSKYIDPVHRVKFASGASLERTLFTGVPVKRGVFYATMPNVDKQILEIWERNTIEYGGIEFVWTNSANGKTYTTVLLKPILYKIHPKSSGIIAKLIWQVSFDIITLRELV